MDDFESPAMAAARKRYRAAVDHTRALVLSQPWNADPMVRAAAYFALQEVEAATFNLAIAPRPEYPTFYIHTSFEPQLYSYALGSDDFLYRRLFLDGRRTYRIWGRRNTSTFVDFQVTNVGLGEPNPKHLGNWLLDDFHIEPDGRFEIIASATPHSGNWIRLDASTGDNNYVDTRECFNDWSRERGVEIHIELADDLPRGPIQLNEAQMIERLDRAGRFYRFILDDWCVKFTKSVLVKAGGYNAITTDPFSANPGAANNPSAFYPTAMWKLAPDEALIFETDAPKAKYWSVQLGNMWWQVLDFVDHRTSLNGTTAVIDADDRFRAVIAHRDPGVPNWLDTIGNRSGVMIARYYHFDRLVTPTVRKVKLAELRRHLPPDTPTVTPAERAAALRLRHAAARARFGY